MVLLACPSATATAAAGFRGAGAAGAAPTVANHKAYSGRRSLLPPATGTAAAATAAAAAAATAAPPGGLADVLQPCVDLRPHLVVVVLVAVLVLV